VTDEIIKPLEKHIGGGERGARFVFHSETAALFWARKALTVFGLTALARERFIAWDVFKAEMLRAFYPDKKPVSRAIRLLYARLLCSQNAESPFLRALIPVQYARDGLLFAPSIARLLASLKLWRAKLRKAEEGGGHGAFADFADFLLLEKRYEAFLAENHLFEPSWEKPPFKDTEHRYFIFYPRLIEDFGEYEELLDTESVCKVESTLSAETDSAALTLYESARTELRAAALEIRRLFEEEGIPYEEMALSCAELKNTEAYITRELELYGIPYSSRSGKPLAEYDAGAFFSRINDCVREHFSWNSIEALLTSAALPWRCPNKNRALLSFGVRNNCVSGYREQGRRRDVWEEAFLGALRTAPRTGIRLFNHYRKLKIKITRLANAKTSAALLKRAHDFFAHFFTAWGDGESTVLGRCVSELSALSFLEKEYPALAPPRPLDALLELLKERIHVRETEKTGVALFDYGVAASIPVRAHFILGANQNAVTRLFRPLSHLRQDKRRLLQVEDVDVSEDFLRAYSQTIDMSGTRVIVRISAARAAFSGAQIPHSYFLRRRADGGGARSVISAPALPPGAGAYAVEKAWWKAALAPRGAGAVDEGGAAPFPARHFPPQAEGFKAWRFFSGGAAGEGGAAFNILRGAFPETAGAAAVVREAIRERKFRERGQKTPDAKLRVSPTSLGCFFICPVRWYYRDILKLEPYETQAKMLDDEGRGILYHEILRALFQRIQREDGAFLAARREAYRLWAEEEAARAAKSFPAFRGPLAAPLIRAMAHAIARNIGRLLELEAASFDGWSAVSLEETYREERETLVLTGKIDRVSVSPDGIPAIIDYKTGKLPDKKDCVHTADTPLSDFQIALYLRLYETTTGVPVEQALFTQPLRACERHIVRPSGRFRLSREEYQETLRALESFIERHEEALRALDFAPRQVRFQNGRADWTRKKIPLSVCPSCGYRPVCRTE
jgi:RecB family exonuclease